MSRVIHIENTHRYELHGEKSYCGLDIRSGEPPATSYQRARRVANEPALLTDGDRLCEKCTSLAGELGPAWDPEGKRERALLATID